MIFGYFTLFVALAISAVAAYYSIVGLTAIFAAALIPIVIMGVALEIGKVTAAVWLKLNWDRAKLTYKLYLLPAVAFLMLLTSMGIFGFLSKAHSDQTLISGDVRSKIAIYDEKIKTARENIEVNRKQLKQMDEAVDQVMGRSTDEKGADKAVSVRRNQSRDRNALAKDIEANQKLISTLNDEAAPIRAEVRKVEAEVGPIKYIAALIYGDNTDVNVLEQSVRWVIILIVIVFDPLALVLILAAQQSLRWAREDRDKKIVNIVPAVEIQEATLPSQDATPDAGDSGMTETPIAVKPEPTESMINNITHPYLYKTGLGFKNLIPMVHQYRESESIKNPNNGYSSVNYAAPQTLPLTQMFSDYRDILKLVVVPQQVDEPVEEVIIEEPPAPAPQGSSRKKAPLPVVPETLSKHKVPMTSAPEAINVTKLNSDEHEPLAVNNGFGTQFPGQASRGDTFLRVDQLPNRLFKFNGFKWIEVDKRMTDSYTYDDQYIDYLIEKLESGEYEIDQLSTTEQELVAQKLQRKNDTT